MGDYKDLGIGKALIKYKEFYIKLDYQHHQPVIDTFNNHFNKDIQGSTSAQNNNDPILKIESINFDFMRHMVKEMGPRNKLSKYLENLHEVFRQKAQLLI